MQVAEYIFKYLKSKDIDSAFCVTGGGIMFLTEALKNSGIKTVFNHHEQACVISAEGYAKLNHNRPAIALVTIGPGASNGISGLISAWHENVPLIFICGQVRSSIINRDPTLKQIGPQEANIAELCKSVSKKFIRLESNKDLKTKLEDLYNIAITGRPGPVVLEVPVDVQKQEVQDSFQFNEEKEEKNLFVPSESIEGLVKLINHSKRPLIYVGNSIQSCNQKRELIKFLTKLNCPLVTCFSAVDVLQEDSQYKIGVIGTNGNRAANFALETCDLLLNIGTSYSITKIGFNTDIFAPNAKKVTINIDENIDKKSSVKSDLTIVMDIRNFFQQINSYPLKKKNSNWLQNCSNLKDRFKNDGLVQEKKTDKINQYKFINTFDKYSRNDDVIVTGNGFECVATYQNYKVKLDQRVIISSNWGSMGWCLPTAIGAAIARPQSTINLFTGDGSIMMNIQELSTIVANNLNVKIFIFNNSGYASIRATQNSLLGGSLFGSSTETGILFPDFKMLAKAFSIPYFKLNNDEEFIKLKRITQKKGPIICELVIDDETEIIPKAKAFINDKGEFESKRLCDMYPYLEEKVIDKIISTIVHDKIL